MTLGPEQLARPQSDLDGPAPVRRRRAWGVASVAALSVAAAIGIGVTLESSADTKDADAGTADAGTATGPVDRADRLDTHPSSPPAQPTGDGFPVALVAPGWTCDPPADEKFTCFNGGTAVLITVRPASSHDAYLTDPDKASPDQYVSDVLDGVFATINRMPDDRTTDVFALGAALLWADQE